MFFFYKGLASNDSDKYPQGGEKEVDFKQGDKIGDVLGGDTTFFDENGNVLQRNPATMMEIAASDMAISDTGEALDSKEESSGSEKKLTERTCTLLEQQIPATSSSQGIMSEGQNNQDVSKPVLKCKYT